MSGTCCLSLGDISTFPISTLFSNEISLLDFFFVLSFFHTRHSSLSLSLLPLLIEFLISPSLSLRIFSLSRRIFLRLFVFYIKFVFSSPNISPSPRSARYCLWMWNLILILSSSSFFFIFTFLSYAFFVSPSRHFCLFLLSEWYFSY